VTEPLRWTAGEAARRLGIREGEGYCFITAIGGLLNNVNDRAAIFVNEGNGEYMLGGGGPEKGHWASAQCVRF
jgi:hypothetical protein